jgi:hypothetical protein
MPKFIEKKEKNKQNFVPTKLFLSFVEGAAKEIMEEEGFVLYVIR